MTSTVTLPAAPAAVAVWAKRPLTVWMPRSSRKTVAPPLPKVLVKVTVWYPAVRLKAAVRDHAHVRLSENVFHAAPPSSTGKGRRR